MSVMFLEALSSPMTRKNHKYQLDRFMDWNKTKDYDDLLNADEKPIQRNLEDYLICLKDKYSPQPYFINHGSCRIILHNE